MTLVSVDCRFASSPTGLGRYTRSLMRAMLRRDDALEYALIVRSPDEHWIADLPSPSRFRIVVADVRQYSFAEQFTLSRVVRALRPDVHLSMHVLHPLFCGVPTMITVHDLILHRYANGASFVKQCAYRALLRLAVLRAARIITPTNTVADDLARHYGDGVRFRTIISGEGVDDAYVPSSQEQIDVVRMRYGIRGEYFLYVGNAKQHKNVPMLLDAYRRLGANAPTLVLVCSGREAEKLHLPSGAILLQAIADDDVPALYSGAQCFVTATLDEGFCLPVVEAIACGCPVIASDIPAIRETAKGRALLVTPTVDAFAAALATPPPRLQAERLCSWEQAAKIIVRGVQESATK